MRLFLIFALGIATGLVGGLLWLWWQMLKGSG